MSSVIDSVNPLNPPAAPAPAVQKPLNHIALVVDESGSIAERRLTEKMKQVVNGQIAAIKQASHEKDQITRVSVFTFSNHPILSLREGHVRTAFHEVHPEQAWFDKYQPDGGTPLNDAVRFAVQKLDEVRKNEPQEAFLVIVITDGEENQSMGGQIGSLLTDKYALGNWTFAFLVPPGFKAMTAQRTGVSTENIKEWEATERGLEQASRDTKSAIANYASARSAGKLQTNAFYTDLSKVSAKTIKAMDDVSKDYFRWQVEKEGMISNEVKAKKGAYEIGKAFYELMKPETIQSHKQVIIGEKKSRKLYGGDEAREILGLTSGPGVDVRVRPGNHGDWRIFVQSTSMNRKLPRGTDILYKK